MARNASRVKGRTIRDLIYVVRHPELQSLSVPHLVLCRDQVVNSFVFSILTANEDTGRAEMGLREWKENGSPREEQAIRELTGRYSFLARSVNPNGNKPAYIASFLSRYDADYQPWHKIPSESASEYRDRILRLKVNGLGLVKTTFACELASGGGDIACIDRHIFRIIMGRSMTKLELAMKGPAARLYRKIEAIFVRLADKYDWHSASALQWSLWCWALGQNYTHEVVYG